jgi:hypothetical protein
MTEVRNLEVDHFWGRGALADIFHARRGKTKLICCRNAHKNTKMEISSLERRVVKSGSGNSNQEMPSGNKVTDLRNVGTLAYNVN